MNVITVWTLIALFTYDHAPTSQKLEFATEEQCEKANRDLRRKFFEETDSKKIPRNQQWYYGRYAGMCIEQTRTVK